MVKIDGHEKLEKMAFREDGFEKKQGFGGVDCSAMVALIATAKRGQPDRPKRTRWRWAKYFL
jgi:hypothetical protein